MGDDFKLDKKDPTFLSNVICREKNEHLDISVRLDHFDNILFISVKRCASLVSNNIIKTKNSITVKYKNSKYLFENGLA